MHRITLVLAGIFVFVASLGFASDFKLTKSTPVLTVEAIEPSVEFWTGKLGFQVVMQVEEDYEGAKRLGFAALSRGDVELMFQTRNSLAGDLPDVARDVEGDASFLYIDVDSIDAVIEALGDVEVVSPKRETFYGATEICVREPGGHLVIFAQFAQQQGEKQKTENTIRLGPDDEQQRATIDDVAWIAGSWKGKAFGGDTEEIWSEPSAGTMAGIFKLMHEGKVTLYEFMMIVEENESLVLKLKHYNDDFSGWESKDGFVSFPLVKLEEHVAWFDGLTYRRDGDGRMTLYLVVKTKDGVREEVFPYQSTSR